MGGLKKSGLFVQEVGGPESKLDEMNLLHHLQVRASENDFSLRSTLQNSEMEVSNVPGQSMRTYKELDNLYLRQSEKLCWDGTVEENGAIRVANTHGAVYRMKMLLLP